MSARAFRSNHAGRAAGAACFSEAVAEHGPRKRRRRAFRPAARDGPEANQRPRCQKRSRRTCGGRRVLFRSGRRAWAAEAGVPRFQTGRKRRPEANERPRCQKRSRQTCGGRREVSDATEWNGGVPGLAGVVAFATVFPLQNSANRCQPPSARIAAAKKPSPGSRPGIRSMVSATIPGGTFATTA